MTNWCELDYFEDQLLPPMPIQHRDYMNEPYDFSSGWDFEAFFISAAGQTVFHKTAGIAGGDGNDGEPNILIYPQVGDFTDLGGDQQRTYQVHVRATRLSDSFPLDIPPFRVTIRAPLAP